jgi:hypothetical protein
MRLDETAIFQGSLLNDGCAGGDWQNVRTFAAGLSVPEIR